MNARLILSTLFLSASLAYAEWAPPANPDPQKILTEARADTDEGRFEDALEKHVWYHRNALKIRPSQAGVRLSFALNDWFELGKKHPPAQAKLRTIRDEAETNVRDNKDARNAFIDLSAINLTLGEDLKTKDLFAWLDSKNQELAQRVFDVAMPSLIRVKEYALCGRYLEPDKSFERMQKLFRIQKDLTKDPDMAASMQDHSRRTFINGTSTLVALLVVNDRKSEAETVAAKALTEWDDSKLRAALDRAMKGTVPKPWP